MDPLDRRVVRAQRIGFQPTFQVHIAVNQISHRHLSGGVVDAVCQIAPQFFLFFPQLCQGFSVNTTPFLVDIGITIVVGAVCSLAFAIFQNTALAILALFRHLEAPFCEKRIYKVSVSITHQPCDFHPQRMRKGRFHICSLWQPLK